MASEKYRSSSSRREAKALGPQGDKSDLRFWTAKDGDAHKAVFAAAKRIGRRTRARRQNDLYLASLYDDTDIGILMSQAQGEFTPQTLTSNVVRRNIDTYVAKISKNKPVPMALTSGGTGPQQRRAKQLTSLFDGILDATQYWPTRMLRIRDSGIWGSGMALNYRVENKPMHERVFPWELRVDPRESRYGSPRTLYMERYVDRLVLQERYPGKAEILQDADGRDDEDPLSFGWDEDSDLVLVRWAWRLPNGDKHPGHYIMCVSTGTLEEGEYLNEYFPFSKVDFSPALIGWFGSGMAEQLKGVQFEVNSIGMRLQENAYMTGTYVWAGAGQEAARTELLDNGTLTQIYSPQRPEFFAPSAWHPQMFDYYLRLRGDFPAQDARISELSSQGEKPSGLDSGKALRTYHEIENIGFAPQIEADERDVVNTCWQQFDLAEEIHEESLLKGKEKGKELELFVTARVRGVRRRDKIDYAKVRADRAEFALQVFPTGYINGTPAEKVQSARELIDGGFLSQDEAMAALDMPDIDRILSLRGAARQNIEIILENILEADDPESAYVTPEPAMNLDLCRALALQNYLLGLNNEEPAEALFWILQFALDAEEQLQGGTAPPPGQGAPPMPDDAAAQAAMAGAEQQYAPPAGPLLPQGAAPPEALPMLPGA